MMLKDELCVNGELVSTLKETMVFILKHCSEF
jgi:hypothetical protein